MQCFQGLLLMDQLEPEYTTPFLNRTLFVRCFGYHQGYPHRSNFHQVLQNRSDHYNSKYGIIPEFKAGCNSGEVSAAEIGIFKKDIAFHGDVINTASRVQDMCNPLKENLLSTPALIDQMDHSNSYQFVSVGQHNLKGKAGMTELYAVKKRD